MKEEAKRLLRAVIFIALFFVGLVGLYDIFRWKDTNGDYLSSFDALYSLDDNVVDVLFLGPSVTYATMNPAYFWEKSGISAFSMSVSSQGKNTTVACIKEVLKKQSPKVVLVDLLGTTFDVQEVEANKYRNTITMKNSRNYFDLINAEVDEEDKLSYLLRWPIIHTRYKELKRYDFEQYKPSIYSMGYVYSFKVFSKEPNKVPTEAEKISISNKAWIDEIVELSKENEFEVIFYTLPGSAGEKERTIINGVADYLNEIGIPFIDMEDPDFTRKIDYSKDFGDAVHMNYYGSLVVDKHICDYLESRFELSDHRGDEKYVAWENALKYKRQIYSAQRISESTNPEEILDIFSRMKDCIGVISFEGDYLQPAYDIDGMLSLFDIDTDYKQEGMAWIVENGEIVCDFADKDVFVEKINSADTLKVERVESENGSYNSWITKGSLTYCFPEKSGIFIYIFDKYTGDVVCSNFYGEVQ